MNRNVARSRVIATALQPSWLRVLPIVVFAMLAPWTLAGCLVKGPPAGSTLPTASTTPALSPPESDVEVPDVATRTRDSARRVLERRGLRMGSILRESSQEVDEGRVVRSVPAAGEMVPTGTEVQVIISTGVEEQSEPDADSRDETRPVPDVIGQSLEEALDSLTERSFQARIEEVEAQGRPLGIITDQTPEAGIRHRIGGTVTIVVTGPPR